MIEHSSHGTAKTPVSSSCRDPVPPASPGRRPKPRSVSCGKASSARTPPLRVPAQRKSRPKRPSSRAGAARTGRDDTGGDRRHRRNAKPADKWAEPPDQKGSGIEMQGKKEPEVGLAPCTGIMKFFAKRFQEAIPHIRGHRAPGRVQMKSREAMLGVFPAERTVKGRAFGTPASPPDSSWRIVIVCVIFLFAFNKGYCTLGILTSVSLFNN